MLKTNFTELLTKVNFCIYHHNCADGFGAAWVVRKALGEENVIFYPGIYGNEPPDVTGKNVLLVDFCYKPHILEKMAIQAKSICILDHHKSAAQEFSDHYNKSIPDNIYPFFDLNHSGAMLAWLHYFPNEEPPQIIKHIEDRDLWKFELANTREIQASVFSYSYDFEIWDDLMKLPVDLLVMAGGAIERKHFKDIYELLGVMTRKMMIGGYLVPVANLPYIFSSDAGHILAENAPFGACYYDTPEGRVFGLRSANNGMDVSEIARQYGGGGHKHAAGFRISYEEAYALEVN